MLRLGLLARQVYVLDLVAVRQMKVELLMLRQNLLVATEMPPQDSYDMVLAYRIRLADPRKI